MEEETIKEVKMTLRSLVVSSPTQMDSRQLMRDYSKLLGTHIPLARMGYRDLVTFLRERCSDSFLLSGPSSNPILTVIVPESSKHIDNFVQRSKIPSTAKVKTKRRSIHEAKVVQPNQNHIYNSFVNHKPTTIGETKEVEVKAPDIIPKSTSQNKENVDHHKNTTVTSNDVKNFLKKRTALYNSLHNLDETTSEKDGAQSLFQDDDSGRHTSSSGSSTKTRQFEELKSEIMQLITAAPEGVWCTDLIRLYRERYNRELNFARFGYTSIVSLLYALEARVQITRPDDTGDWLLTERARAAPAPPALRPRALAAHAAHAPRADQPDPDDALPGVQFDEDVFPADCMRFSESIPALSLADCRPGAMLEVMVGEVYSPSHFWLIRLGERYNLAMEDIMDEMTLYYSGEGRGRALARGAVRVGHYCSTLYENDWHRSVIVKIIDSDTVKVRHVDYGTVESVRVSELRALRREWGALPAQAVRARLAGLRPSAAGRRWPHAAAAHFLRRVQDKRLYANVVAVDTEHDVLETLLIDTRGAEDVCVSTELIRAGHADARADSALRTAECYLYPRFEALEEGDTPNMAEIHAYLRDGIALDYVDAYRRHVPMCLPEPEPPGPPPPGPPPPGPPPAQHERYVAELASPQDTLHELYVAEPPAPPSPELGELATRIPLLWPCAAPAPPCPTREDPASVPPAPAAPPPARTLPAPVFEQTPGTPPRDSRPPEARVEPSVVSQSTINPEAQSFTPKHCYNREPAAPRVACAGPMGAGGAVTLSAAECAMYRQLACVHPGAAHCYMASTLARAMGRPAAAGPQPAMGPPVGAAPWHSMGPPAGAAPWPSMGFPNGPWPSMGPPNGVGLWPAMGPPTGLEPRPAMGSPSRAGPWPTIGPPDGAGPWTAMGPSDCVGPGPRLGPMRWPPGFRP